MLGLVRRCLHRSTVALLITMSPVVAHSVSFRHDVAEANYVALGMAAQLEPGMIITRSSAPIPGGGVLIHKNYVLTAGHIGSQDGPADVPLAFRGKAYRADRVRIFPGYDTKALTSAGNDLSVLHIAGDGISDVAPATIWTGCIAEGQVIQGVGQGKGGTGLQNDEPLPPGTFRGYENTVDVILGPEHFGLMMTDFDGAGGVGNSLATDIYFLGTKRVSKSSSAPLPLEGTLGAGDSGSGIWLNRHGAYHLVGISTGRYYSSYMAQSMYVNLTNTRLADWIRSVVPDVKTAGGSCVADAGIAEARDGAVAKEAGAPARSHSAGPAGAERRSASRVGCSIGMPLGRTTGPSGRRTPRRRRPRLCPR